MSALFLCSVVKTGSGALVITIPKPWAACHGIRRGDKVEVVIVDGDLLICVPQYSPAPIRWGVSP